MMMVAVSTCLKPFGHTTKQEIPSKKSAVHVVSVQVILGIATKIFNPVSIVHVKTYLKSGSKRNKTLPDSRKDIFSSPELSNSFQDIQAVIFGYWMGPDMDDGWGYVEAIVDLVLDDCIKHSLGMQFKFSVTRRGK